MSEAGPPRGATRRQEILSLLEAECCCFEDLRAALRCSVRTLESDLQHVARSLRRGPRRLRVTPARCGDCDFRFRGREPRHFHPPSRCPRCRSEHIVQARLRVEG